MVAGSDVLLVRRSYIYTHHSTLTRTTWRRPRPLRLCPSAEVGTVSTLVSRRRLPPLRGRSDRDVSVAGAAGATRCPYITRGACEVVRTNPRRIRFSVRDRSVALKCTRPLGYDVTDEAFTVSSARIAQRPKGLSTPRGLRVGPKEMRIPPLRSAVQMGSDVSLDSSVTPDRSPDPRYRTIGPLV